MVDVVQTNTGATPPGEDDPNAAANAKAMAAADKGGVTIDGVQLESDDGAGAGDDKPTRPDNVPEKFWDAEKGEINITALLASNAELESQFTRANQGDESKGSSDGEPKADPIQSAFDEFASEGELSDETYAKLAEVGITRETVQRYIAGQQSMTDASNNKIIQAAGGSQENLDAMMAWASENLSQEEIVQVNAQLANDATVEYAVQQLYSRFSNEADHESNLIEGENSGGVSTTGYFKSSAEMQAAMSDPKYATDPAFRAEVEKKIINAEKHKVRLFG